MRVTYLPAALSCLALLAVGCVKVVNTDGIDACLAKKAKAEVLAYKLKTRFPSTQSAEHKLAETMYDEAAGDVNGFLDPVVSNLRLTKRIDVPKAKFEQHDASASLKKFLEDGPKLMGSGVVPVPDPVTAAAIASGVKVVLDGLIGLHNKLVDQAVRDARAVIEDGKMVPFSALTLQTIKSRYPEKP
ncbi:MAG: hypothetical protein SGJ19_05260 [Planctomycetia bacterium]|nr:hypothetical protein [Planctomycetia bacterium]